MTGKNFLDLLMSRLGGRTDPALRTTCLLEAQHVQETVLEGGTFLPWFLISEETEATLTINERRLEVPDDFIRELEDEGALIVVDEAGEKHELVKKSFDELRAHWGLAATADVPSNYALVGKYFMIFPLPLKALTVQMRYYAKQTLPNDDNTETQWLKYGSDLLLAETGYIVASKHVRDDEKAGEFQNDAGIARSRLIAEGTAREEANRDRSMG